MLVRKLIPAKFLALMIEIIISGLLLATRTIYPIQSGATETTYYFIQNRFIAGCSLVLVFSFTQLLFTFSGINIYNVRIHF